MAYVRTLEVNFGAGNIAQCVTCFDQDGNDLGVPFGDINKDFGGEFVYLKPVWVADVSEAAKGFRVWRTYDLHSHLRNLAQGTPNGYRYQESINTGQAEVRDVALLRSLSRQTRIPSNLPQFAYMSDDINVGRYLDFDDNTWYLYIIWGPKAG